MKDTKRTRRLSSSRREVPASSTQLSPGPDTNHLADMYRLSPEMYTQYMYNMYNYMYMQQQLSMAPAVQMMGYYNPAMYTTPMPSSPASTTVETPSVKTEKQQVKKGSNVTTASRYAPYNKAPTKSPKQVELNDNEIVPKKGNTNSATVESPLDLSRKSEKLHFLNTLKDILESKEKKSKNGTVKVETVSSNQPPVANGKTDKVDNRKSTEPNPSLTSQEDKLGYIKVLKELFERGHSSTSQAILKPETGAQNISTSNRNETERLSGKTVASSNETMPSSNINENIMTQAHNDLNDLKTQERAYDEEEPDQSIENVSSYEEDDDFDSSSSLIIDETES